MDKSKVTGAGIIVYFDNSEGAVKGLEEDILLGDQTIWWVFNDNGNIHTETGSESAIGLEIQAQAFGFTTND